MIITNILKKIPFFSGISKEDNAKIIENINLNYFPPNHIIFKQGESADKMYVIRSGSIKIYTNKNHYECSVAILKENDFFGEMALISNFPRNASAKTLDECELFSIDKNVLYSLLKSVPQIPEIIKSYFLIRTKEIDQINLI